MIHSADIREWREHEVVDPKGHKIGLLEAIYVDTTTDALAMATVRTGLPIRHRLVFVPLDEAILGPGYVKVAHSKGLVKRAPSIGTDDILPAEQEEAPTAGAGAHRVVLDGQGLGGLPPHQGLPHHGRALQLPRAPPCLAEAASARAVRAAPPSRVRVSALHRRILEAAYARRARTARRARSSTPRANRSRRRLSATPRTRCWLIRLPCNSATCRTWWRSAWTKTSPSSPHLPRPLMSTIGEAPSSPGKPRPPHRPHHRSSPSRPPRRSPTRCRRERPGPCDQHAWPEAGGDGRRGAAGAPGLWHRSGTGQEDRMDPVGDADQSPVGAIGRVTVSIPSDGPGEVLVAVRGGTEAFAAWSETPIPKHALVIVVDRTSARSVVVELFPLHESRHESP